ncbi:MAG: crossover junction endodeoxyribonuclease RuvC [Bacteroidales bacterium]|jgi:crossover junction endodeoxyribonuclease RuvC|nr:crossover junction endodeoxyribonuclease RuvC [Bacteroidales bacterium]
MTYTNTSTSVLAKTTFIKGQSQIILGIDPGTNVLGYSFITLNGKKIELLEMDILKLSNKDDLSYKMKIIFDFVTAQVKRYKPDILAIEAPFFGKNVQSMLKLGRVQGLCIAAALATDIPFVEFSPRKIKQSITGNGASSKEQVASMLGRMINIDYKPKYLDATDALAVAVCYAFQKDLVIDKMDVKTSRKKTSSWTSFITNNPKRVKE